MVPEWAVNLPWEIIREKASLMGIDPLLVASIVMVESTGNPYAIRYEPAFYRRYVDPNETYALSHANNIGSSLETEKTAQATSWGLMQIMGLTARELGFKDWHPKLCEPSVGIEYGSKLLKQKYNRYGSWEDAVSAYNAGSVRMTKGKLYENQRYVDKVYKNYRELNKL